MATPILDRAPYTIDSLPYGVISTSSDASHRCAVAIGHHAIDLAKYSQSGSLKDVDHSLAETLAQVQSPALADPEHNQTC